MREILKEHWGLVTTYTLVLAYSCSLFWLVSFWYMFGINVLDYITTSDILKCSLNRGWIILMLAVIYSFLFSYGLKTASNQAKIALFVVVLATVTVSLLFSNIHQNNFLFITILLFSAVLVSYIVVYLVPLMINNINNRWIINTLQIFCVSIVASVLIGLNSGYKAYHDPKYGRVLRNAYYSDGKVDSTVMGIHNIGILGNYMVGRDSLNRITIINLPQVISFTYDN